MNLRALILFCFPIGFCAADDKLDPMTRDEDISQASLKSTIKKLPDGKYEYRYVLHSPATSKGTISAVKFDVYCENMPDIGEQQVDDQGLTRDFDSSRDGRHIPLQSKMSGTNLRYAGVTRDNMFTVTLENEPGQSREFILLSNNPPGYLPYAFRVSEKNEKLYGYWDEAGQLINENAPWYERWEVHGVIKGPACIGRAATPMTRPTFDGQRMPTESRDIDSLLRFEVPGSRNRWHAAPNVNSVKFRVYYSYFADENTFKVTINGVDSTNLFNPDPGAYEEVTIPLQGNQTLIEFSVDAKPGYFNNLGDYDTLTDVDQFEIRK